MTMHIITNFEANAGAEAMLARLLRASGDDAFVASLLNVSDRNRLLAGSATRCEALGVQSIGRAVTAIRDLAALIIREQPRVILCWMYHAMVAGLLAQRFSRRPVPVFWNVRQSLDDPSSMSRGTRNALAAAKQLSHLPDGVIYNSSRSLELHRRYGFVNGNAEVIPNGFDIVAAPHFTRRRPQIVGIAARFHPQKDHATFFEAAAIVSRMHPAVHFVAAGDGLHDGNAAVRDMLKASGLAPACIELCGEVEDMDNFYRGIDILVLSSRTEGFPNVVAEAMSYGKPVVTTDVGDAGLVVGDTGIVVPPGKPEALAQGLSDMLGLSPDQYIARSKAARDRVRDRFSLPEIARRYGAFLGAPPRPNVAARRVRAW